MLSDSLKLKDLIPYLPLFGLKVVGNMGDSTILVENHYTVWALGDNGGEINVWKVNHWEGMRSVPTSHSDPAFKNPDAGTACYRVRCVVDGTNIDYGYTIPSVELDDCLTTGERWEPKEQG